MACHDLDSLAEEWIKLYKATQSATDYQEFVPVPGRPYIENYVTPTHMKMILGVCEEAANTDYGRLMLLLPPGSAKSTIGSVVVPTYLMGKKPGYQVILGSYSSTLAKKHARKARSLCRTKEFERLFDCTLSQDTSAVNEWHLTNASEYMATGIGGSVTGSRANLLIIDDPIRGRQDAESVIKRLRLIDSYQDDLKTRLKPNGSIIIIQTRWAKNDLAGHILPEEWNGESGFIKCRDGRTWNVLCIQAQCERDDDPLGRKIGEYLWPEYLGEEYFKDFKMDARTWGSLFQQIPTPPEGGIISGDWLQDVEENQIPPILNKFISTDFATSKDKGDWTEIGVFGICKEGNIWIVDWWSGRETTDVWIEAWIDLMKKHKPLASFGESGVIKNSIEPVLKRRMVERKAYCRMEWLTRTQSKDKELLRVAGFQSYAACGRVRVLRSEWGAALKNQLSIFPSSPDDKVDVCALFGMAIDQAHPAIRAIVNKQHKDPDTYGFGGDGVSSWKTK